MALHNCDEVAVAGFGYDMNTPHAPLHYYETVKMSAIKEVRRRGGGGVSLRVWVVLEGGGGGGSRRAQVRTGACFYLEEQQPFGSLFVSASR